MDNYIRLIICQILISLIQSESKNYDVHPSHYLRSQQNNSLNLVLTSQFPIQETEPKVAITTPVPNELSQTQTTQPDCTKNICVRKCCPIGHLLDFDNPGCKNVTLYNAKEWIPDPGIVRHSDLLLIDEFVKESKVEGKDIKCLEHEDHEFSLQQDGKVYHYERREYFEQSLYCIDHKIKNGKISVIGTICYENATKSKFNKIADNIRRVCISISTIFLFAIMLHFVLTRSNAKKDLQSKCMISSCSCLFFGYLILMLNNFSSSFSIRGTNCVVLAISNQFFLLAFYFWLSIMCYEISRVIRGTMKLVTYQELMKSSRRYYFYCFYAWGSSLLICTVTVIMQYLPEDLPAAVEYYIIRPNIAQGRCWFKEIGPGIFIYYYGIEIFLHILNASYLTHTYYLLHKEQISLICCKKESASANIRSHASKNHLETFKQRFHIFILYLLIWILNVISLIESNSNFWRFTDVIVSLQGVFLFIIVVRPKVYALIIEAYVQVTSFFSDFWNKIFIKNKKRSETNSPSTETEDSVV